MRSRSLIPWFALTSLCLLFANNADAQLGSIVSRVRCGRLRDAFEDPIVSPGKRSDHLHSIFGADTFSDTVGMHDLQASVSSTCDLPMDRSMYWNPSLMYRRRPISSTIALYLSIATRDPARAFPLGLRVIADSSEHRRWFCIADKGEGERDKQAPSAGFPPTDGRTCMRWQVRQRFPPCWDGRRLDSHDHMSHMAYAVDRRCPESHPIAVPELRYVATFPVPRYTGGLRLSNDRGDNAEGLDMHFDFISGWDESALDAALRGEASGSESSTESASRSERRPRDV
jgi:hypothetical protein